MQIVACNFCHHFKGCLENFGMSKACASTRSMHSLFILSDMAISRHALQGTKSCPKNLLVSPKPVVLGFDKETVNVSEEKTKGVPSNNESRDFKLLVMQ